VDILVAPPRLFLCVVEPEHDGPCKVRCPDCDAQLTPELDRDSGELQLPPHGPCVGSGRVLPPQVITYR
jgi:hypothetical protein